MTGLSLDDGASLDEGHAFWMMGPEFWMRGLSLDERPEFG